MYIEFKSLVLMAFAMWSCLVLKETLKLYINSVESGSAVYSFSSYHKPVLAYGELCPKPQPDASGTRNRSNYARQYINWLTFFAGAFVVIIYNRHKEITFGLKKIYSTINETVNGVDFTRHFQKLNNYRQNIKDSPIWVAIVKYSQILLEVVSKMADIIFTKVLSRDKAKYITENAILLKKLRDVGAEMNNLGQVLIAALQENKQIRLMYQLEVLSRSRLAKQFDLIRKQTKDSRARHANFQQLYLVTHQENIFLKARIAKVCKQKEDIEKTLITLTKEVLKHSDNHIIKAFCSKMLRQKEKDVNVRRYFHMYRPSSSRQWQVPEERADGTNWPSTDIMESEHEYQQIFPSKVTESKPQKGFTGELTWAERDYLFNRHCDAGDTLRIIKDYSVYKDKTCLLDCKDSSKLTEGRSFYLSATKKEDCNFMLMPSQRFVSDSEAFQRFLRNNNKIVDIRPASTTSSSSSLYSLFCTNVEF